MPIKRIKDFADGGKEASSDDVMDDPAEQE